MMRKLSILYVLVLLLPFRSFSQTVKILFDATKAESAANADWIIDADTFNLGFPGGRPSTTSGGNESNPQRFPTPLQSTVTSTTPETYWKGSLSSWAIALVKLGYGVETLPYYGRITYGDNTNAQDLSNYKVFIVDEPNILFTTAEKTALLSFVQNGGGLFMISDHAGSDRNNDGHDSPSIWNDFMTSSNNVLGITWANNEFSQTSSNIANIPGDSILHGPSGTPVKMQYSGGSSLKINPALNSSVTGVIYVTGCSTVGDTGVMMCRARYGRGKVVATGDSSPMDDGTGDPNDVLYNGWTGDAGGNHVPLIMNATIWLAQTSAPVVVDSFDIVNGEDTTICLGRSVTITAHGATSYVWQPGGFTTASITVQPTTTTLYIVTGTTGSLVRKDTMTITVDQFSNSQLHITPAGSTTICQGNSLTLSAPAGYSYAWNNGAIAQNLSVSAAQAYYFTATDANGCRTKSDTVQVSFDPFTQTTPQISANGPLIFCTGGSVTLTAPAQTSYQWSSGSGAQSISATQSGTYSVTLTNANGCHATSNAVTVSVDAFSQTQPQISANGPLAFCTGGSVILSAPAGYTYHWNNNSTQQNVTATQSGAFFLTVTDANNCSAKSDTAWVSVSSSITGVQISPVGPQTVCSGSNITLAAPAGYSAYAWSTGATSQSITVTQQGIYYLTVSSGNNCHGVSDTTSVSTDNFPATNPQISASGPTTFCQGSDVIFSGTVSGGIYHWSSNVTQPTLTVTQSGIYRATISDANNCSAASQSITVTVNPLPQITFNLSPDSICSTAGSLLLNATPSGGTFSGTGVNGMQFVPAVAGTGVFPITYSYTDNNGCNNTGNNNVTVYVCTGIEEILNTTVSVYPNPSSGTFVFETSEGFLPNTVKVFDETGRLVVAVRNTQSRLSVDLNNFTNGIYIAVFEQGDQIVRKKLVKAE